MVLINYLWRLNYSEYCSPSPLANLQMFCIRAVSWEGREREEKYRNKGSRKEIVEGWGSPSLPLPSIARSCHVMSPAVCVCVPKELIGCVYGSIPGPEHLVVT